MTQFEKPLFPLGRVVMTTNLERTLLASDPDALGELMGMFQRHQSGDWGDLGAEDKALNDEAAKEGLRILSAYVTRKGIRLWIITEWDRSVTTALLPEDY
jgi:hypothetical protein